MNRPSAVARALGTLGVLVFLGAAANAQTIDIGRPATLVTGTPRGGARFERIDPARSGLSPTLLPASGLRTAWHASLGLALEQAPLVDAQGTTYVAGVRGDVVALDPQGEERWRVSTGSTQPGPLVLLSDDSVVFVDASGEAVAVRQGAVRWRTRFGRGGTLRPAPLPLDDGGVVVATSHELAVLDGDGNERARTVLAEPAVAPIVMAMGRVVVVSTTGTVWGWAPGAPEATRLGTFGSAVDGAAVALAGDEAHEGGERNQRSGPNGDRRMLLAVSGAQARLAVVDLARRSSAVRAVAPGGIWLGPPAVLRGVAYAQLLVPTGELAIAIAPSGAELGRAVIALRPPTGTPAADAGAGASRNEGAAAIAVPTLPHTAPLVDANGTLAFATSDGSLGVVAGLATPATAGGPAVELVVDACPPSLNASRTTPPVTGIAPLGPGAFVAACASGTVLAVRDRRAAPGH
jgi:outer membrane protein assembly factor BamB